MNFTGRNRSDWPWLAVIVGAVVSAGLFSYLGPLDDELRANSGFGIVDLELARPPADSGLDGAGAVEAIVGRWRRETARDGSSLVELARRGVRWDFLLIAGYWLLLTGLCALMHRQVQEHWRRLWSRIALLPAVAAACDAGENVALLAMVEAPSTPAGWLVSTTRILASIKFFSLFLTVVALVVFSLMRLTASQQPQIPGLDAFFRRHEFFVRSARDAAHQVLFFLGLLSKTDRQPFTQAVEQYREFALEQVKGLVRAVHIRGIYQQRKGDLAQIADAAERERVECAIAMSDIWQELSDTLDEPDRLTLDDVPALRRKILDFLELSRAGRRAHRLGQQWIPDLLRYLKKHLALIVGWALVLGVLFGVEAIRGLLVNEGLRLWLPLALLLVPPVVSKLAIRYLRHRSAETVPFWDIGGRAFRSLRELALEPGRLIARWPKNARIHGAIVRGQLLKMVAYLAWWLVALAALAFVDGGSTVTVFLALSLCYAVVIAAQFIDFWEFLDPNPVRLIALLVTAVCLLFMLYGQGRTPFILLFGAGGAVYGYLYVRRRQPMLLTLSVIGFLLAATMVRGWYTHRQEIWAESGEATEDWRLDASEWPHGRSRAPVVVMTASGGGSRAALYAARTLTALHRDLPEVAEQLQAISSVSGGSLATAAYVARRLRGGDLGDLVEALESDFLRPTLLGALLPGTSRGRAIEQDWQWRSVDLQKADLRALAERWREALGEPSPPFPLPLFNTASMEGHNVVLSPLHWSLYGDPEAHAEARSPRRNLYERAPGPPGERPTWVYYRDEIYGLEELLGNENLLLAQAVRASANFPFGFPLVRLKTERPRIFSPDARLRDPRAMKLVKLTDGGALSNSGLWSLFHLLRLNVASEGAGDATLKQRGVLVLLVEASKMPTHRNLKRSFDSLRGTISDQDPVGRNLHNRLFDQLESLYGDRIALVQIDLWPRQSYNIMTTWSLDQNSLDTLDQTFLGQWPRARTAIAAAWRNLREGRAGAIDRARPPLD